ncbi:MAG: FIST N-terminal domain-containing protein [Candidatus Omnitrophota bacterium]
MATFVGTGVGIEKNSFEAARQAALQAKIELAQKRIDIGFVFASNQLSNQSLLKGIRETIGPYIPIVGASSEKIIHTKNIERNAVAVMLISSDQIHFSASHELQVDQKEKQFNLGQQLANNLLLDSKTLARHLCIWFTDGLLPNQSGLTLGLQQRLGRSFPIIGGSSSDGLRFKKNFQFHNEDVFSNGISATLCGGKLNFASASHHGWKPLGKPHQITFSIDNIIYEIDNEPAINLYKNYFSMSPSDLKIPNFWTIAFRYPLGIYLNQEKQYLLRPVIEIGPNGSLICQSNISFNKEIRLMMATRESCLGAADLTCLEIKEQFKNRQINFCFIFQSLFREKILGRDMAKEINLIRENLGKNIPFIGLNTYTEQAPLRALLYEGQSVSHCGTISILAIGE